MSRKKLIGLLPIAAVLLIPLLTQNPYLLHMFILSLLWIVLGQSWNLLGGYTGQISYGHAAFFGVGAYTTGIMVKSGQSPSTAWWGLLFGGLMAALVAAFIGWVCFRLRGSCFSLSVLALFLPPPPAWWGLLFGGLMAALVAAFIGWVCFRLRGSYFSLSVLALSEVLRLVAVNWNRLTNGAEGILFIPPLPHQTHYD